MQTLAIVGAGPKAAAIAAKAAAINSVLPKPALSVTVFERHKPMAAWRGAAGYTDGTQPLCTLAERDLGFPYNHVPFGGPVVAKMLAEFSWSSFATRQQAGRASYADWVLRGRNPPSHQIFSDYIEDALDRSGAIRKWDTTVTKVLRNPLTRKWEVEHQPTGGGAITSSAFDGVVVTGSGAPKKKLKLVNKTLHVAASPAPLPALYFDGSEFWNHLSRVESALRNALEPSMCLIGGGGTAAAIAHWCIRTGLKASVTIIGTSPTLYGRHRGFFEDRLFTEDGEWELLGPQAKREFVSRQTSGVVWESIVPALEREDVDYRAGRALLVTQDSTGEYLVDYAPLSSTAAPDYVGATVVVDARGFDLWWFASLLAPALPLPFPTREEVEDHVSPALEISGGKFPDGFHAPMVGFMQGPAAGNLMGLGWMADRILSPYVPLSALGRAAAPPSASAAPSARP